MLELPTMLCKLITLIGVVVILSVLLTVVDFVFRKEE